MHLSPTGTAPAPGAGGREDRRLGHRAAARALRRGPRRGWSREELEERIGDVRRRSDPSATKLDAPLIAQAARLRAVGRAGVGVDNVDVDGGDQARDHRRQRAAVQCDHRRRAHDGAAAGARAQRPAGPRLADRRRVGALEVLRRRAVREDARDPRLRQDRPARGRARAGVRNARDRLRPVRCAERYRELRRREGRVLRRRLRGGGLHHAAPAEHARHQGLARRRGAGQVQGRRADLERGARPARRRRGSQGGARLGQGRRRGARRVPAPSRSPTIRCSAIRT